MLLRRWSCSWELLESSSWPASATASLQLPLDRALGQCWLQMPHLAAAQRRLITEIHLA
jgi:hypothetical protein